MNSFLFQVYRVVVPKPLRTRILKRHLRLKILDHLGTLQQDQVNDDHKDILDYLSRNPVSIFPYPFSSRYSPRDVKVFSDDDNGMNYVLHEGKKLYFRKRWSERRIRRAWADLSREQDPASPHRYLADDFLPGENDVIADIGAAEGNFALAVIDKVRRVILVEYDKEWISALEATFAPWREKTVIIPKYAADINDGSHVTLDSLVKEYPDISFIKIDVDGFEQKVLDGLRGVLASDMPVKIALCTYHKANDERDFSELLKGYGFRVEASKGYMINYYDKKIKTPWLRRGLIRAVRP